MWLGLLALPLVARAAEPFRDCPYCPEMIMLPAGDLPTADGAIKTLPSFAMGRFSVTFDEYDACVAAGACRGGQDDHGWGRGRRPVINVTWADAQSYVRWLGAVSGGDYALATEAEFEYAARGGTATAYWWGDLPGQDRANCRDCGSQWSGQSTAPVGSFPPNPFGLYDMNGNVWAWTADCRQAEITDAACADRVIRGGAWYYFSPKSAASARSWNSAQQWSYTIGFRVVRHLSR